MRRLPYLNGIKAFEAAARSGSFAAAAGELNVSPAAISRMVHLLEERLGVALFERKANRLALTATGHTYQAGPHHHLRRARQPHQPGDVIGGRARAHHRRRADLRDPLADSAAGGFPESRARHRGAVHHRRRGGAVRRRLDLRDHARRRRLAGAHRRAHVRRRPARRSARRGSRAAQARQRSERADAAAGRARERGLAALAQGGGRGRIAAKGPEFEYYGQAIQAAADGVGVAMGIRPYIDDDLAAGRLVAPFALTVPKGQQWYLVYRDFRKDQRDFVAFRKWLLRASVSAHA